MRQWGNHNEKGAISPPFPSWPRLKDYVNIFPRRNTRAVLIIFIVIFHVVPISANQRLNGQLNATVDHWINDQADCFISEYKKTKDGEEFLKKHNKADLRKTIVFLQYPIEYFAAIQEIPDLFSYIWAFQLYLFKAREIGQKTDFTDFYHFLHINFQSANRQNVPILTHLILVCDYAVLGEALVDIYTKLFEFQYEVFISDLGGRKNWKYVINSLTAGDWRAFKAGLAKLSTSKFELELKGYVASLEKTKIKNEDGRPSRAVQGRGICYR